MLSILPGFRSPLFSSILFSFHILDPYFSLGSTQLSTENCFHCYYNIHDSTKWWRCDGRHWYFIFSTFIYRNGWQWHGILDWKLSGGWQTQKHEKELRKRKVRQRNLSEKRIWSKGINMKTHQFTRFMKCVQKLLNNGHSHFTLQ